jgi:hypothetical protein
MPDACHRPVMNVRPSQRSEYSSAWKVIPAAAVGVALGTAGLPIYTTGRFILPLGAFGWSRSAIAGGLAFLTIGSVLMAPVIGSYRGHRPARRPRERASSLEVTERRRDGT